MCINQNQVPGSVFRVQCSGSNPKPETRDSQRGVSLFELIICGGAA